MDDLDIRQDSTGWLPVARGGRLFVRHWVKPGLDRPRAVMQIVHGMAEHSLRYERLARRLNAEGIEVWAPDLRGHGLSAAPGRNDPQWGGIRGHCADTDALPLITGDIDTLNQVIREKRPGIPCFLMGHSWGSFLAQHYIETRGNTKLAGCILSGTRGPGSFKIRAGAPLMAVLARLAGVRRYCALSRALADGAYNKPFRPNRTPFDWLSRDNAEVDKYAADPLCGFPCSAGFYRDLTALLTHIHRPEQMERIDRRLPVYIFSGSADPVGDMGASPTALVDAYRTMGIGDLEFVLYPDARHECLNETNKEEVTENLLAWIEKHISPGEPDSPSAGTSGQGQGDF
ncbi:MAG: lysophospholipase [Treponema sp.]|jgi:alpha-beta hydrolase superfamily lysophospholipase|nr:lysophospholipase [Treponema sp.]